MNVTEPSALKNDETTKVVLPTFRVLVLFNKNVFLFFIGKDPLVFLFGRVSYDVANPH